MFRKIKFYVTEMSKEEHFANIAVFHKVMGLQIVCNLRSNLEGRLKPSCINKMNFI